jgi:hypothetical protein
MIDAGCGLDELHQAITRAFPANGKFTGPRKRTAVRQPRAGFKKRPWRR